MLITFEGIDGSGKSTQALLLYERFVAEGRRCLLFREPGGTRLSERVRALLKDPSLHVAPFAELLLFSAARAQLVEEAVRPALDAGTVVLLDRFYDSTVAYQGAGRELENYDWLRRFNERVTGGLTPARTYLIEVEPSVAAARRAIREGTAAVDDRMESADPLFFARVQEAYVRMAREEPARFLRLDGNRSVDDLHDEIYRDAWGLLDLQGGTAR